jgi:hypothetical protein
MLMVLEPFCILIVNGSVNSKVFNDVQPLHLFKLSDRLFRS